MLAVQGRCFVLTQYLASEMRRLHHDAVDGSEGAGEALCVLYGLHATEAESECMSSSTQGTCMLTIQRLGRTLIDNIIYTCD
jgi:hypothetical protein